MVTGRLQDGEAGESLRISFLVSLSSSWLRQTAALAGLVTTVQGQSLDGSCPCQARHLSMSSEPSWSHSLHQKLTLHCLQLVLGPLLFSFVILFSPNRGSCSRLGSCPENLAHAPSSWAFAIPPGYSHWVCLPSLHLVLQACSLGPAELELGRQGCQQASIASCKSKLGIHAAWVSLPVHVPGTKCLERFTDIQKRKSSMQSRGELCPASTFTSNTSALKMYKEIKRKPGQIALMETHPSCVQPFPMSAVHCPIPQPSVL